MITFLFEIKMASQMHFCNAFCWLLAFFFLHWFASEMTSAFVLLESRSNDDRASDQWSLLPKSTVIFVQKSLKDTASTYSYRSDFIPFFFHVRACSFKSSRFTCRSKQIDIAEESSELFGCSFLSKRKLSERTVHFHLVFRRASSFSSSPISSKSVIVPLHGTKEQSDSGIHAVNTCDVHYFAG